MVATDSPFLHLVRSRRLLSKFQGPFRSTHSIWYIELNLNCRMFCPTSTIRKSEPIFQADWSVLFRARRFWCRLASSGPNKLNTHSSSRSNLLMVEMVMSSSSSLVSLRCWMPSKTLDPWLWRSFVSFWVTKTRVDPVRGESTRAAAREKGSYGERKVFDYFNE